MKIYPSERDYAEDYHGDDTGQYMNRCSICAYYFYGHKYRRTCKKCMNGKVMFGLWEWVLFRLPDIENKRWSWITFLWIILANPMIGILYFSFALMFLAIHLTH